MMPLARVPWSGALADAASAAASQSRTSCEAAGGTWTDPSGPCSLPVTSEPANVPIPAIRAACLASGGIWQEPNGPCHPGGDGTQTATMIGQQSAISKFMRSPNGRIIGGSVVLAVVLGTAVYLSGRRP